MFHLLPCPPHSGQIYRVGSSSSSGLMANCRRCLVLLQACSTSAASSPSWWQTRYVHEVSYPCLSTAVTGGPLLACPLLYQGQTNKQLHPPDSGHQAPWREPLVLLLNISPESTAYRRSSAFNIQSLHSSSYRLNNFPYILSTCHRLIIPSIRIHCIDCFNVRCPASVLCFVCL